MHWVQESTSVRQWGVVAGFRRQLQMLLEESAADVVIHDHGVWLPTNHGVAQLSRQMDVRRVVSPRGMLSRWAMNHGRFKKRLAWLAYQRRDLQSATAFHATSDLEADEIRALGLDQPIAVIPNGIEFPPANVQRPAPGDSRTMLFLSRIHPKKGLLNLLRAWKLAAPAAPWRLVIAGPDDGGHLAEVRELCSQLELDRQVDFPGPVDDAAKWPLYASADLFVLPSFSENFGLVVAEAMAAGLPVIATTGAPWREVHERGIGWQVAPAVEPLAEAIRAATTLPDHARRQMGLAASQWVRSRFAWEDAAERMLEFYHWLLNRGHRPKFVQ